jgi:hypothetical protein
MSCVLRKADFTSHKSKEEQMRSLKKVLALTVLAGLLVTLPVIAKAGEKKAESKETKPQSPVILKKGMPTKEQQARLRDLFRTFYLRSLPGLRELYFAVDKSLEADIPEKDAKELAKLRDEAGNKVMELRKKADEARKKLREGGYKLDIKELKRLAEEMQKANSEILKTTLDAWEKGRKLLSAKQLDKLAKLQEKESRRSRVIRFGNIPLKAKSPAKKEGTKGSQNK